MASTVEVHGPFKKPIPGMAQMFSGILELAATKGLSGSRGVRGARFRV